MWRKFSLQFAPCVLYSVQCSGLAARRQKFKRTPEWWRRNDLSTGSFYNEPNLVMVLVITEFWNTFINFILKWSDWRDTIGSITVDFIITLRFRIYVLENSFFGYPKSLLSQALIGCTADDDADGCVIDQLKSIKWFHRFFSQRV